MFAAAQGLKEYKMADGGKMELNGKNICDHCGLEITGNMIYHVGKRIAGSRHCAERLKKDARYFKTHKCED